MNEHSANLVSERIRRDAAKRAGLLSILAAFGVSSCHSARGGTEPLLDQMLSPNQATVSCQPRATEPGDTAHRSFRHLDGDSTLADWGREVLALLGPDGRPREIWIVMTRQRAGASDTVVVLHGQFDRDSSGVVELMRGADDSIGTMISHGRRGDTVSSEVAARVREFAARIWSDWCGRGS